MRTRWMRSGPLDEAGGATHSREVAEGIPARGLRGWRRIVPVRPGDPLNLIQFDLA